MATDSTNLPRGEATFDAGIDMAGSDLDLTVVQVAQSEPAQWVDLPKGNVVILLPVQPGQTVRLPTDTTDHLLAKIGPEGNLAIVVDGRTIILQGYLKANDQSPIKIVTNDGDTVDVADVIAATDPSLDIQTAAGPATGGQGEDAEGSGIYVPFLAGPGLGGILAEGILDPTALQYRLIDDEYRVYTRGLEDASPDFGISFDLLGGIINEDDLGPDQPNFPPVDQLAAAKFVLGDSGTDGEGNDPFDTTDHEDQEGDGTPGIDSNANGVDDDREPLETVVTVKVDFNGQVPGSLTLDLSKLPAGLTSEGRGINYELVPADPGVHGNGIIAFVDNPGGAFGVYDDGIDDKIFTVDVDKDESDGEFKVTFKLYDNLDNEAPDSLIGADEQILDIPVHFTIKDSNGSPVTGTLPLGVEDDIPFFGQVVDCAIPLDITHENVEIVHDETPGVQPFSDDVSIFNPFVALLGLKLGIEVDKAGFEFPFGESEGTLIGAAKTKVHVSFGADGPTVFIDTDKADLDIRNSVFGALQDKADGTIDDKVNGGDAAENEHPFELFMVTDGTAPDKVTDSSLTIEDQKTNATVTWGGTEPPSVLPVYIQQIDANTIVGYVQPDGEGGDKVAVFALNIDDSGCLSFFQMHQINHDVDGPTFPDHDDPFTILGEDGTPLIYVRATDYDGDHAIAPVNLEIQDDGPKAYCDVDCVTEGETEGEPNFATGNVVTGAHDTVFGNDANNLDGNPDSPGVDQPYTISKIKHDGQEYILVEEGDGTYHVEKGGVELPSSGDESFDPTTGILTIPSAEGGSFQIVMVSDDQSKVGDYKYTVPENAEHDSDVHAGPETLAQSLSGDFSSVGEWTASFSGKGITLSPIGGNLNVKSVNVAGGSNPDYRGIGVTNFSGDEVEVDLGGNEGLRLNLSNVQFPGGVNNIALTLGALFDGVQFDNGNQEILEWKIFKNGVEVGSGQILGDYDGVVTLDIDSLVPFDQIELRPIDNGQLGETFKDNSDFLLINAEICYPEDKFIEEFEYTLRDADGDTACATLKIDVKDTEPTHEHGQPFITALVVDEDGLPNGVGNTDSPFDDDENYDAPNAPVDDAKHYGTIPFTPGADPTSIELSVLGGPDTKMKTLDGEKIFAAWDAALQSLIGYIEGTDPSDAANQVFKMTITDPLTGAYTFELLQPVKHDNTDPFGLFNDTENAANLPASFFVLAQIEDKDCDVLFSKVLVTIDDDMPVITESAVAHVDEDKLPAGIEGGPGDDGVVPASFTGTLGVNFGADEGKSIVFSETGQPSLKSHGQTVKYDWDGNPDGTGVLYGYVGSDSDNPDSWVFKVEVQSLDNGGEYEFTLLQPLDHPDSNNINTKDDNKADDGKDSYEDNLVFDLKFAATDGDDDKVSGKLTVNVDDDSPDANLVKIEVDTQGDGALVHDETAGDDGDDDVDGPLPQFAGLGLTAIGFATTTVTVDLSGGGADPEAAYGADGPGKTELALTGAGGVAFSGAATNLFDTATGEPIFLYTDGDLVLGRVGSGGSADAGGDISFALSIDDAGNLSVAQYLAIKHPDASDHDDPVTLLAGGENGEAVVFIEAKVTDYDGDAVKAYLPLDGEEGNGAIIFEDDGPNATCDYDQVTEGKGNIATGNVVSGVNPENPDLGTDANGTDGNADTLSQDQPHTISKLTHGGHAYELVDLGGGAFGVTKDGGAVGDLGPDDSFDGSKLTIKTAEGATFEIIMVSTDPVDVGEYKYTAGDAPIHAEDVHYGASGLPQSITLAQAGPAAFAAAFGPGITLEAIGGTLATKTVNVNPKGGALGVEDYGGIGVASSPGDEVEVDQLGLGEALKLNFATPTDNAEIQIGALFNGVQYDNGIQEILKWEALAADGVTVIASGQIVGVNNGLAVLDVDTDQPFSSIKLTPLNNGATNNPDNSDFVILSVEVCHEEPVKEEFGYTLRDGDGDESSATLKICVEDTYPQPPEGSGTLAFTVDEDGLPGGVGNNDSPNDAIATSASFAGNIPFIPGVDPVKIELNVGNGGDTGLKTLGGQSIFAAWDAVSKTLIGYIAGTDPSDAVNQIFKMTVTNDATGAFTFDLLKPIKHADGGPDDNTENDPDPFFLVNAQIEDKDCDVAFTTVTIGIDDDMPIARDDTDTVDDLGGGTFGASGNVVTGADTTSGNAGKDDKGADSASVSELTGEGGTDTTPGDGLVVVGKYGTLTMDADGNYSYDVDESKLPGIPEDGKDVFTYTLKDGDGDTDTATLTIDLPSAPNFVPDAVDDNNTAGDSAKNFQLMLVLDRSGSMDEIVPNSGGKTRFELARDSLIALIEKVQGSTTGTVSIKLVLFNNTSAFAGGSDVDTFISADAAITYLQGLSTTFGNNGTDYDAALWDARQGIEDASWVTNADTISRVYWVSDGRPTEAGNAPDEASEFPGGGAANAIDDVEQGIWETTLDDSNTSAIAIGIGTDIIGDALVADQLARIAHDPGVADSGLVEIIDDINALSAVLLATVPAPVNGNLLGNDSAGDPSDPLVGGVVSIVDLSDDGGPVAATQDLGTQWKIETAYGILIVDKVAPGNYGYTPKPGSEGKTDTFQYTIQDTIGSNQDTAVLSIAIQSTGTTINGTTGNDTKAGGLGNDTLNGGDGNDVLWGGDGNDIVNGDANNDRIYGGAGNDELKGGSSSDTYIFVPGDGKDNITDTSGNNDTIYLLGGPTFLNVAHVGSDLVIDYGLSGLVDRVTVVGHYSGDDDVETINIVNGPFSGSYNLVTGNTGGKGDDLIAGTSGDETLSGDDGDDLIFGGGGTDTLNGNDDNDVLVWQGSASTYNGGDDTDTLDVSGTANVDFTAVGDSTVSNIEVISMRGGGGTTVKLNAQDIVTDLESGTEFAPSDGGVLPDKASLRVDGDNGDTLQLSAGAGEWVEVTGSVSNEPDGYRVFAFDTNATPGAQAATVQSYVIVQDDITVNVVP